MYKATINSFLSRPFSFDKFLRWVWIHYDTVQPVETPLGTLIMIMYSWFI